VRRYGHGDENATWKVPDMRYADGRLVRRERITPHLMIKRVCVAQRTARNLALLVLRAFTIEIFCQGKASADFDAAEKVADLECRT
jgi:hypothetical protein